jgi:diadenosine tetraphosphate (Ap4A) HIT family hydrolase
MTSFALAPAFLQTSTAVAVLGLSEARLQLDARWPWIVLIPRRAALREIEDLTAVDRAVLMEEIVSAGDAVRAVGEALNRPVEKLNVGALGNITAQLHVHVVGRRADDPAWPGPVWGVGEALAHADADLERALAAARAVLALKTASELPTGALRRR